MKARVQYRTGKEIYALFGVNDLELVKSRLDKLPNTTYLEVSPGCYFIASHLDSSNLAYELLSPANEDEAIHEGMVTQLSHSTGAFRSEVREWVESQRSELPHVMSRSMGRDWSPAQYMGTRLREQMAGE